MKRNVINSAFLSHNSNDKNVVRNIGNILEKHGIKVWIDEAEIKVGDSLIEAISNGINKVDCLLAFISQYSIKSNWVKKELSLAITKEVATNELIVMPIILDKCEIPFFLSDKLYLDYNSFENELSFFSKLFESLGLILNPRVFETNRKNLTLNEGLNKAHVLGLRLLSSPFHRPFQYLGLSLNQLQEELNTEPNGVNNFKIETNLANLFIETEGNYATYIEVELNQTKPHHLNTKFESEPLLATLSINPAELDKIREQIHFHSYYDHRRKLKISVSCPFDGSAIVVGFSSKYYGD